MAERRPGRERHPLQAVSVVEGPTAGAAVQGRPGREDADRFVAHPAGALQRAPWLRHQRLRRRELDRATHQHDHAQQVLAIHRHRRGVG